MKYIVFDIETMGKTEAELEEFMPEFEASKVLKDPDKIKADLDKKKEEWLREAPLKAERGAILVIGLLDHNDNIQILEGDERDIIEAFWSHYRRSTCQFLGHNIKNFDVPFLVRRSWVHGLQVPSDVMSGRYLGRRFGDTMEAWSCGTRDMIKLDTLAKMFGVGAKNGSGEKFAGLYLAGGSAREDALNYLKNDLTLTRDVAKRMGLIFGGISDE